MKIAKVLENQSKIDKGYQKFKKQLYQAKKDEWTAYFEEKVPEDPDAPEGERKQKIEKKTEKKMKKYQCMYSHLETLLISIEVADQKGKNQTVFFPKFPVFDSLAGNLRDKIMLDVCRDSHREKIVSLLSYTDGIKEKMEYSYNL